MALAAALSSTDENGTSTPGDCAARGQAAHGPRDFFNSLITLWRDSVPLPCILGRIYFFLASFSSVSSSRASCAA